MFVEFLQNPLVDKVAIAIVVSLATYFANAIVKKGRSNVSDERIKHFEEKLSQITIQVEQVWEASRESGRQWEELFTHMAEKTEGIVLSKQDLVTWKEHTKQIDKNESAHKRIHERIDEITQRVTAHEERIVSLRDDIKEIRK